MSVQARHSEDEPVFPCVARRFAATLLEARYAEVLPGELIYDGHAGPFLQALLNACSHDTCVPVARRHYRLPAICCTTYAAPYWCTVPLQVVDIVHCFAVSLLAMLTSALKLPVPAMLQ